MRNGVIVFPLIFLIYLCLGFNPCLYQPTSAPVDSDTVGDAIEDVSQEVDVIEPKIGLYSGTWKVEFYDILNLCSAVPKYGAYTFFSIQHSGDAITVTEANGAKYQMPEKSTGYYETTLEAVLGQGYAGKYWIRFTDENNLTGYLLMTAPCDQETQMKGQRVN